MLAEKAHDRIPMTQEERRAIIEAIMEDLDKGENQPPKPRRWGFPSWSVVYATLIAGLIGSTGLLILVASRGGEAGHLYYYLGSMAACVVSAFFAATIASSNARGMR
jgi:hypothetical protein